MSNRSAFEKRLKRHIVGRVREYFAATAPGLEPLCRQELQSLPLTVQESRTCPGGVIFQGRLVDCFMANLHLRTANRILMRIDTFKATRFQELEKKLSEWPWELFLQPLQAIDFHVSAKKSKLYHTDAIADRFRSSITGRISIPQQEGSSRNQRGDSQHILFVSSTTASPFPWTAAVPTFTSGALKRLARKRPCGKRRRRPF